MIDFQGVRGGVGYNDTASDQDSRRRQQLAKLMLEQSNATPAVGWAGALNKILSGAIAGYQINKDGEEQKARGDAKNDTLARALQAGQGQAAETKSYGDGTTINWDERKADPQAMAAILAGNRDTAPMGMQMQIGQMDEKRKNEAATAAALLKRQNDREDEFYKPIKTDDGSIIIPALMPGFQMPGQAPRAPVPAPQAPGGGVDMRTASAAPNPPPVQQQPLAAAGEVPEMFQSVIGANAERTGLDPRLLGRVFMKESGARQDVVSGQKVSSAGAQGPMQVMPGTQRNPGFGVAPAKDGTAEENFRVGSDYLAAMHQKYGGDTKLALMAYNWGPGNVDTWLKSGADPSKVPAETRNYVAGIAGDPQQPPAPKGVQVADASGAIPQSALPPGAPPNQPGVLYKGQGKAVRNLTAEELVQNNLPKGASAQIDGTGKITLLSPGEKPRDVTEMERNWRTDFKEPIKQATELSSQIGIIKNATGRNDGTGDIAAITAFNKLLDPGAVVREADVALTMKAQGLAEQLQTWMANKQSGDVLPPELRVRMAEMADQVYQTSNAILKDRVMPYRDVIEGDGGKFDRVLPPALVKRFGWGDQPAPTNQPSPQAAPPAPPAAEPKTSTVQTFSSPTDPGLAALPSGTQFRDPNGVLRIKP